ncbi:Uncharacterized protein ToN1_43290 [Aromatoleum petrolei]|nr:Uncharacterized protein ToN1_43290 [Aromatoleum petrolei]
MVSPFHSLDEFWPVRHGRLTMRLPPKGLMPTTWSECRIATSPLFCFSGFRITLEVSTGWIVVRGWSVTVCDEL